jgi:hypothetical protein
MGVSHIADSIVGKMGLVNEQNITNFIGFSTIPMLEIQLAKHMFRLKMLNAQNVTLIQTCVDVLQTVWRETLRMVEIILWPVFLLYKLIMPFYSRPVCEYSYIYFHSHCNRK